MFSLIFLTLASISACSGQFLNCGWVATLDCKKYPVFVECGTDGTSYDNRCTFAKAQCQNKDLHIEAIGACPSGTAPSTTTTAGTAPTKPTQAPMTGQPTTVVMTTKYTGPTTTHAPIFLGHNAVLDFFCLELSHETCPQDTEQVCGTDGKTYSNFCEYEKARCTHRTLNVAHYGGC